MRKLTTIVIAGLVACGAVANDVKTNVVKAPVSKEEMAQRRKLAAEFMDTMKLDKQIKATFKMVRQNQAYMLKKLLKNDKQIKDADKFQDKMMKIVEQEFSADKLKPIFVDSYASVYTSDELQALIKFFSSPKGQAFIEKSPEVNKIAMLKRRSIMIDMANRIKKEAEKYKKEAIKNAKETSESQDDQMM